MSYCISQLATSTTKAWVDTSIQVVVLRVLYKFWYWYEGFQCKYECGCWSGEQNRG
jgi:hypothetical protein